MLTTRLPGPRDCIQFSLNRSHMAFPSTPFVSYMHNYHAENVPMEVIGIPRTSPSRCPSARPVEQHPQKASDPRECDIPGDNPNIKRRVCPEYVGESGMSLGMSGMRWPSRSLRRRSHRTVGPYKDVIAPRIWGIPATRCDLTFLLRIPRRPSRVGQPHRIAASTRDQRRFQGCFRATWRPGRADIDALFLERARPSPHICVSN